MLPLYISTSGTFVASSGAQVSPQDVQLNILIELRVLNQIQIAIAQGNFNVTLEELRAAVITDSVNPVI